MDGEGEKELNRNFDKTQIFTFKCQLTHTKFVQTQTQSGNYKLQQLID